MAVGNGADVVAAAAGDVEVLAGDRMVRFALYGRMSTRGFRIV